MAPNADFCVSHIANVTAHKYQIFNTEFKCSNYAAFLALLIISRQIKVGRPCLMFAHNFINPTPL